MWTPVVSLAFVFGLLGGVLWFLRRFGAAQRQGRHMSVIESVPLGPGKSLSLVRVAGRCFLVGTTKDQVSTLAELSPAELAANEPAQGVSFKQWSKLLWEKRAGQAEGASSA